MMRREKHTCHVLLLIRSQCSALISSSCTNGQTENSDQSNFNNFSTQCSKSNFVNSSAKLNNPPFTPVSSSEVSNILNTISSLSIDFIKPAEVPIENDTSH